MIAKIGGKMALWASHSYKVKALIRGIVGADERTMAVLFEHLLVGQCPSAQPVDQARQFLACHQDGVMFKEPQNALSLQQHSQRVLIAYVDSNEACILVNYGLLIGEDTP